MHIKNLFLTSIFAVSSLIFANTTVFAAGSSDDEGSNELEVVDVDYMNGKEQAYDGNYRAAIVYLKKSVANNPENSDAFNLLGYSNRKLGNNDEAFTYYNKALKLDPRPRGTHEYIGRLYLNLNQLENAKKHLAELDDICFFGCEEYTTLKEAIQYYEKNKVARKY